MRKASVLVWMIAAVLLWPGNIVTARSGTMNAVKKHSTALMARWQKRLGTQKVGRFLQQAGMAVALCTALACGKAAQHSALMEGAQNGTSVQKVAGVQEVAGIKIRTEGVGPDAIRVIDGRSVAAYWQSQAELSEQFYDMMIVHYVKNGTEYVRVVDSPDSNSLAVRHADRQLQDKVELATIAGVVIGDHPNYGEPFAFSPQHARGINDDGGKEILATLPPDVLLYGKTNMIFTDGSYALVLTHVLLSDGSALTAPTDPLFLVDAKHLIVTEIMDLQKLPDEEKEPQQSEPSDDLMLINALLD